MLKKIILLIIFYNLIFFEVSTGQEPPYLKDVQIKVTASMKDGIYVYAYSVTNGVNSTGDLYSVDVDISFPQGGAMLSSAGLTIPHGKQFRTFEQETPSPPSPKKRLAVVPVGMEKPNGWIAGIGLDGFVGWGSGDNFEIKPGRLLGGFNLMSYGLPGIRSFKTEPWLDEEASYYPGWESVEGAKDEAAAMQAKIKELIEKVSFKGKTIGPTAPPADFKPAAFLDYIIDLKHQAVSLGWIKNEGIVNSLDVKLDNARKKIAEGSLGAAKNILNAFINDVEAQGCATYENCPPGKHLTSEAYALLKYNAQYLIDNLSK